MDSKINKFYSQHEDEYLEKIIENFSSQPSPKIKLEEIIKIVKENYHNKYIKINWTSITHLRKWDFINAAIKKFNKKNIEYLEIGVFRNENFDLINCENKISVDPDPESKATFKTTSDEFFSKNKKKFDVIFGMYHDQVLTPFKALFKYNAVNITLGLPYIRVSPDHGIAKDIIGKNIANPNSLMHSIKFFNNIN